MRLRPYVKNLSLTTPIHIFDKVLNSRSGIYVELERNGSKYLSECSPLPGLHDHTLEECLAEIQSVKPQEFDWSSFSLFKSGLGVWDLKVNGVVRCALEHLILQCYLGEINRPLPLFPRGAMPLQKLIIVKDHQKVLNNLLLPEQEKVTLKLKLGYGSAEADSEFLKILIKRNPNLRLRLDFNDRSTFKISKELWNFIDYIEDPSKEMNLKEKIAWDTPRILNSDPQASISLVIKPTLFQGISHLFKFLQDHPQNEIILSSCYELGPFFSFYKFLWDSPINFQGAQGLGTIEYCLDPQYQANVRQWISGPYF